MTQACNLWLRKPASDPLGHTAYVCECVRVCVCVQDTSLPKNKQTTAEHATRGLESYRTGNVQASPWTLMSRVDMHLATAICQVVRKIDLRATDRNAGAQHRIKESPTVGLEPTTTRLRALRSAG